MKNLAKAGVVAVAGSVGVGIMAIGATAASGAKDDVALNKRDDTSVAWVVDDADDDDDATNTGVTKLTRTNDNTAGTNPNTNSRHSANTNDNTNSRYTKVSNDRDNSRGDLTKDWTRDGGDRTRDFSRHLTNDNTRNDTRGR